MSDCSPRRRVLIMGAAGRDFHNFLCCYRDNPQTEVVAFTATQIPHIAGRRYPASLAGPHYPSEAEVLVWDGGNNDLPFIRMAELEATINATPCDAVIFGTPVDLRRLLTLHVPAVRVSSGIEEIGQPTLEAIMPLLAERTRTRHA